MTAYPYIPNALPEIQRRMLREIGLDSIDQLYDTIPERIRFRGSLDLPPRIHSEVDLRTHIEALLANNMHTEEYLSSPTKERQILFGVHVIGTACQ